MTKQKMGNDIVDRMQKAIDDCWGNGSGTMHMSRSSYLSLVDIASTLRAQLANAQAAEARMRERAVATCIERKNKHIEGKFANDGLEALQCAYAIRALPLEQDGRQRQ